MMLAKAPCKFHCQKIESLSLKQEMRLYTALSAIIILFFVHCVWSIRDLTTRHVPFVIKEPMGPKSNGPLALDTFGNMDYYEKPVQLNMEWEYESSTALNDIRSANKKQISKYSTIRFTLETYNHDGWVIFG